MQAMIFGGRQQRSTASAAAPVNNSPPTPAFVRVDGEWIEEDSCDTSGTTTKRTHTEALPFTAASAFAAATTLVHNLRPKGLSFTLHYT